MNLALQILKGPAGPMIAIILALLAIMPLPGHTEAALLGFAAGTGLDPLVLASTIFALYVCKKWWHTLLAALAVGILALAFGDNLFVDFGWMQRRFAGASIFLCFILGIGAAIKPRRWMNPRGDKNIDQSVSLS